MLRRDFLARLAGGAASAALGRSLFAYPAQAHKAAGAVPTHSAAGAPQARSAAGAYAKLDRIAISTWSLHNYFRATRSEDCNLSGPWLALLDFPDLVVNRYKVRHFEFCTAHFGSTEMPYLQEIRYALIRTRSTIVNMPVNVPECASDGTFSDPDSKIRLVALAAVKKWVDVAHVLGASSVRVGPGKVDPENLEPTVESYKALATYALAKGVRVIVENQDGFGTEHPEELVKLLKLAGPGRIGALPDFGNFPDESTREKGLKLLFPYAPIVCHVKGLEFDANGVEKGYDFHEAMEIAKKSGFRGIYSIEFSGRGDPYMGIQKTLDELLKYV